MPHHACSQVGDGTTSVVLLASEILRECKQFVEEGVHPHIIARGIRKATSLSLEKIKEIAVHIPFVSTISCIAPSLRFCRKEDPVKHRDLLMKCAATTLSSKLVARQKDFFAKLVVDAVMDLDELLPLNMIGIKKVQGGALEDSQLIHGVAFKKTFSYAGFEMQPKTCIAPKV